MAEDNFVVTYKPSGLKSHRSSPDDWGWVEWLEEKHKQKLFLFQRLDQGTSGLMLIATSEMAAAQWSEKLKSHSIKKHYLFISKTQSSGPANLAVSSRIEKEGGRWVSHSQGEPNSETHFTRLETYGTFQLWQAQPRTGKAHQIRLHAQSLGLPILGDDDHGGAPFFRLCLHAHRLEDPQRETENSWTAPAPSFFTKLSLLEDPDLCALLDAFHQREQLKSMGLLDTNCFRLVHQECPDFRIDAFGEQLWVYNYQHPQGEILLQKLFEEITPRPTFIREMQNRGQSPNSSDLVALYNAEPRWQATECDLHFELRADQGLSPGLFLDQRENRQWVKNNSREKRVLNLFAYTCGFSVAAATGGAKEVVSVDVSRNFIEWGKHNFSLNDLNPEKFEFWVADTFDYLKGAIKRGKSFDLIICDPPSFGRSKRGVFKINQDIESLVAMSFQLLVPGGKLLLCSNYEDWTANDLYLAAVHGLPKNSFSRGPHPLPGLDFLETQSQILKVIMLQKIY